MSENSNDAPLSIRQQNKYFEMAKHMSQLSDFQQHKIGAIFVYKGKVIASEKNSLKTNPLQKEYNKLRHFEYDSINNGAVHAECACILKTKDMDIDWNKVSVFIFRQHKNGIRGLSAPCPACRQALIDKGIKKIYYTGENSYIFERIG
jgi:deoxycytidylate deaminase